MSDLTITLERNPRPEDQRVVTEGLLAYNASRAGDPRLAPFALFVRGPGGAVVGGLLGRPWWEWLYVEQLWIPESLRGRRLGARLLREAEAHAVAEGCRSAFLDTIDPDALAFYRRRGYGVFGTLEGFPPGRRQFFLRKDLTTAGAAAG